MKSKEKQSHEEDAVYSVNLERAMKITGLGKWALMRRVWKGLIPASKPPGGGNLLFKIEDLKKLVDDGMMDIRKTA